MRVSACKADPLDARAAFKEAVLEFSEEPTPVNARRYLAASRLLALATARAAQASPPPRPKRRARAGGGRVIAIAALAAVALVGAGTRTGSS